MPEPHQGEIWWAELPRPVGRRPVLVLTRSSAVPLLTNVTIAPLTRTLRGVASEVPLDPVADLVPTTCVVSLENIITIPKSSLRQWIAELAAHRMAQVFAAIRYALDMPG